MEEKGQSFLFSFPIFSMHEWIKTDPDYYKILSQSSSKAFGGNTIIRYNKIHDTYAYPAAGQNLTNPPSGVYNPSWANYPLRNLINNAGFDRDLNAWTKTDATNTFKFTANYDPLAMYDRETRTGFGSARLGGGVDGIEQVVTGLTPNTKYIVSVWGRVRSHSRV